MSKNENKHYPSKYLNPIAFRKNFEYPFTELVDTMFKQFFNDFIPAKQDSFLAYYGNYPKCDIKEYPQKYQIEMEIPGMKKEDIKVEYDKTNQILSISGTKRTTTNQENVNYIRRELKKSEFVRSFYISKDVIGDQIEKNINVTFDNGILLIQIKKKEKNSDESQKETTKIPIK